MGLSKTKPVMVSPDLVTPDCMELAATEVLHRNHEGHKKQYFAHHSVGRLLKQPKNLFSL